MASGGRRPGGDAPWWVTGIKVVAGIGAAAIGVYAAARAAETAFQEEEPMRSRTTETTSQTNKSKPCHSDSSDSDDDDDRWVEVNDDDEYSDSSASDSGHGASSGDSGKPLVEQLEEFYQGKVHMPKEEITAMKAVAEQVAQSITEYIRGHNAKLLQSDAFASGSVYEGTAVQHPDRFVIVVPLNLEANMWKMVNAKNTVLKAPGYSLIHRINTDFFRPGSSVWDRFLVGTYLNSELIQRFLEGVLQKVTNKGFTFDYSDYYVSKTHQALTLEIMQPVAGLINHLTLQVIPSIRMKGADGTACFEGTPYGFPSESEGSRRDRDGQRESDPYENLWHQSTRPQQLEVMEGLDEDGGCRKKCLQIFLAVCLNQSPLDSLPPNHLKNIFLHLCEDESEWEDVMMAERFFDILKCLEQFVEDQHLPNFFSREINMFEGFPPRRLNKIKTWLEKKLKQPNMVHTLLI